MKSCFNFGRSIILSLNKKKLKGLAILPNEFVNDQIEDTLYLQWYLGFIGHVEARLFENKADTPKEHKTANKLNIFFTNKEVEIINLSKVLRSQNVCSKIPSDMSKDDIPMVT